MKIAGGILFWLALWAVLATVLGSALLPTPWATAVELGRMAAEFSCWHDLALTLARILVALTLATLSGVVGGVLCGLWPRAMDLLAPLVAALQACPAIVWISLLMVWVGLGSIVPITAIFIAAFPVLFLNTAQGVAALNARYFDLARVYRVPWPRRLRVLILRGSAPYLVAGLSFALGVCWKVAATAEFIGSGSGVGAALYWSYRRLDLPRLFGWMTVLILLGVALEVGLIRGLRRRFGHPEDRPHA